MRSFHIILFHRRQAQTLWRERRRAPARVCASLPSKPYSTVGRRKPSGEKGAVRPPEFAPPARQSLIPPSAGANPSARKAPWARPSLRLLPVKACYEVTVVKRRLQERFISRHGTFVFSCQHLEGAAITVRFESSAKSLCGTSVIHAIRSQGSRRTISL